jgi:hypothetical protein
MFFPGVRRRVFHLPHALVPFSLAVLAICLTVAGWATFAPSRVGDSTTAPGIDVQSIKSIAFTVPGTGFDDLVVQPAAPGMAPQVIASFPNDPLTRSHARGAASPQGDRIAVIWLPALATAAEARLSFVDVATRRRTDIEGAFDYFTAMSWSSDGSKVALVNSKDMDGLRTVTVYEVDVASQAKSPVAAFENVFEAVPVGYSFDGSRLFSVVIDQRGSNLYTVRAGRVELVGELSPGRTGYWALSPDGARLAFVDILGSGSRRYVGRTMTIATGAISTLPAEKNHFGASWMPGSPLPSFGGPGGAWQLTDPGAQNGYIVPDAWSPDGELLVATVYSQADDPAGRPLTAIEIITPTTTTSPSSRYRVSDASGASFLGWVKNLN